VSVKKETARGRLLWHFDFIRNQSDVLLARNPWNKRDIP
jgi:hypothetical protein